MSDKEKLETYHDADELDVPYLPWLEEAQQQYYEETMRLTPQERALYWENVRDELTHEAQLHRKRKKLQASRLPLRAFQPAGTI